MELAGGDGGGGAAGAEVDGGEVVAHFAGFVTPRVGVAVAQPAGEPSAPAFDVAGVEQGAHVSTSRGDGGGGAAGSEVDWR